MGNVAATMPVPIFSQPLTLVFFVSFVDGFQPICVPPCLSILSLGPFILAAPSPELISQF